VPGGRGHEAVDGETEDDRGERGRHRDRGRRDASRDGVDQQGVGEAEAHPESSEARQRGAQQLEDRSDDVEGERRVEGEEVAVRQLPLEHPHRSISQQSFVAEVDAI
jgi:hypothetical protein